MAIKTRVQLQTDADTIKNETVAGQNTATRVGGYCRDLLDSIQMATESAGPAPVSPTDDLKIPYATSGNLAYAASFRMATGLAAIELGAVGQVGSAGTFRVEEGFSLVGQGQSSTDCNILSFSSSIPSTITLGENSSECDTILSYAATAHNAFIGANRVFQVSALGINVSPGGVAVASAGDIRVSAAFSLVAVDGSSNDANVLGMSSGTLTIGETSHMGTVVLQTAGGGFKIQDSTYSTNGLEMTPTSVFFPLAAANVSIGHNQAASGGGGQLSITARAAAAASGANGASLNLHGGAKDGAGAHGPVNLYSGATLVATADEDGVAFSLGRKLKTTRVTSTPYAILATDDQIYLAASSSVADLPAGVDKQTYRIINTDTASKTVNANGTDKLFGTVSGSFTLMPGNSIEITFETTDGWY
jgi:hypothetical protein